MKTLVFLSGMIPFRNSDSRKDVVFLDFFDATSPRRKTKLGRLFGKIKNFTLTSYALLTHLDADCFVFFESGASYGAMRALMKAINRLSPHSRRILYIRNRVILSNQSRCDTIAFAKKLGYELWTYDRADSERYLLKFNPQVLDRSLFHDHSETEVLYSAVFVGNAKGRKEIIDSLQKQLTDLGLNTLFYVHEFSKDPQASSTQQELIPYEKYVSMIEKSASIIDIVNEKNYGLTVRPLEALFAQKKLITNYPDIIHFDFYHEDNIFIFSESNIDQIPAWLEKPYHPIDETILARYDIDVWLKRFEINVASNTTVIDEM